MEYSEKLRNSSEKLKTQTKNSKLKQKTQKLKDSANPFGLLAENASKKKAVLNKHTIKIHFKQVLNCC